MKKPSIILFALISMLILSGCAIRTPQINGLVLDEETKKPVPDAWVTGMITIEYFTVAGKSIQYISIGQPHIRTDKDGKFVIPSGKFKGATFPFEFGNDVKHFGVGASTADDRGGSISLMYALSESEVNIKIYIKPKFTDSTESEYFTYLQGLYNYCLTGRFSVETPAVEGGCDEWELDYTIKKHERFLERLREPDPNGDRGGDYTETLHQLGNLLKKYGNYRESLNNFIKLKEFSKKRKTQDLYRYDFNVIMPELEKHINENSTK